jgi:uncharacterized protein
MADLAQVVAGFGHLLHAAGVPVTPERSARFAECVVMVQPTTLAELSRLGRTTLVSSREEGEIFDRVFAQVFMGMVDLADFRGYSPAPPPPAALPAGERTPGDPERGESGMSPAVTSATPSDLPQEPEDDEDPSVIAALSDVERLSQRDFATCTEEELALIERLVEELSVRPPLRRTRRRRRHVSGRHLDVRATLRASHRTGGDPVRRIHRKRVVRPRRVVLIADVSGSMEPYARIYLHLMRGAVRALHAEAFVFATSLTRLTRALGHSQADVAYRSATRSAPDWSGGTRIGRALQTFVDQHGRRGMARGAVVIVVSDGWEVEDPARVEQAMQQLARLAHRVIWVNPRKVAPGYQPLVGGMAAALPYIDTFVSGHSVESLEDVLGALA